MNGGEPATLVWQFENFTKAGTCKSILSTFHELCDAAGLKHDTHTNFYRRLKSKINFWKAQNVWVKLDKHASRKEYRRGEACSNTRVLVIGAGPCGLRAAIELVLLGARVVLLEKRDSFSRNNVLHLWPFLITDLKNLGAKKFFGKFCAGAIDHISIRQLQCILMKVALLLGVEIHVNTSFDGLIEPPTDQSQKIGWRAKVTPADSPVAEFEFDVLIGADGKRNTLQGFKRKEFRGKLAIAITANFINRNTQQEARVEEISGVAFIFNQKFFKDLNETTGVDLENIVYYKDDTHYFVMTAKKSSLLDKGVLLQDHPDTATLLSPQNISKDRLLNYAKEAADFSTNHQLPVLDYAINHYGQPDVAMFDFTSMFAAVNASRAVNRNGHTLLLCLVGDSLLEPFWPTGSGCARGFLGAFDAAWMVKNWASGKMTPLQVLAERECIYQVLSQTTPENLNKNHSDYTIDPNTRYSNMNMKAVMPQQVRHLYDTGDGTYNDEIIEVPAKRVRNDEYIDSYSLLRWCQRVLNTGTYRNVHIVDLTASWRSGLALCALIHYFKPDLIDFQSLMSIEGIQNSQLAFSVAETSLGISPVMSPQEMVNCSLLDKLTMVSYLSQFYHKFKKERIATAESPRVLLRDESQKSHKSPLSRLSLLQKLRNSAKFARSKKRKEKDEDKVTELSISKKKHKSPEKSDVELTKYSKLPMDEIANKLDLNQKINDNNGQNKIDIEGNVKVSAMAEILASKFQSESQPVNQTPVKKMKNPGVLLAAQPASEVCYFCKKRVYLMERMSAEGLFFHRGCLKCDFCDCGLRLNNYSADRLPTGEVKFFCFRHSRLEMRFSKFRRKHGYNEEEEQIKENIPKVVIDAGPSPKLVRKTSPKKIPSPLTPPLSPPDDELKAKKTPERIEFENSIDGLQEESEEELTEHNLRASLSNDALLLDMDDDDMSDSDLDELIDYEMAQTLSQWPSDDEELNEVVNETLGYSKDLTLEEAYQVVETLKRKSHENLLDTLKLETQIQYEKMNQPEEEEGSDLDSDTEEQDDSTSDTEKETEPSKDSDPQKLTLDINQGNSPSVVKTARANFFNTPPEPLRLDPWKMFDMGNQNEEKNEEEVDNNSDEDINEEFEKWVEEMIEGEKLSEDVDEMEDEKVDGMEDDDIEEIVDEQVEEVIIDENVEEEILDEKIEEDNQDTADEYQDVFESDDEENMSDDDEERNDKTALSKEMEKLLADIDHKSSVSSGDQILKTDDSSLCDEDVAMSDKMSEDNRADVECEDEEQMRSLKISKRSSSNGSSKNTTQAVLDSVKNMESSEENQDFAGIDDRFVTRTRGRGRDKTPCKKKYRNSFGSDSSFTISTPSNSVGSSLTSLSEDNKKYAGDDEREDDTPDVDDDIFREYQLTISQVLDDEQSEEITPRINENLDDTLNAEKDLELDNELKDKSIYETPNASVTSDTFVSATDLINLNNNGDKSLTLDEISSCDKCYSDSSILSNSEKSSDKNHVIDQKKVVSPVISSDTSETHAENNVNNQKKIITPQCNSDGSVWRPLPKLPDHIAKTLKENSYDNTCTSPRQSSTSPKISRSKKLLQRQKEMPLEIGEKTDNVVSEKSDVVKSGDKKLIKLDKSLEDFKIPTKILEQRKSVQDSYNSSGGLIVSDKSEEKYLNEGRKLPDISNMKSRITPPGFQSEFMRKRLGSPTSSSGTKSPSSPEMKKSTNTNTSSVPTDTPDIIKDISSKKTKISVDKTKLFAFNSIDDSQNDEGAKKKIGVDLSLKEQVCPNLEQMESKSVGKDIDDIPFADDSEDDMLDEKFYTPKTSVKNKLDNKKEIQNKDIRKRILPVPPMQFEKPTTPSADHIRELKKVEMNKIRENAREKARLKSDEELGLENVNYTPIPAKKIQRKLRRELSTGTSNTPSTSDIISDSEENKKVKILHSTPINSVAKTPKSKDKKKKKKDSSYETLESGLSKESDTEIPKPTKKKKSLLQILKPTKSPEHSKELKDKNKSSSTDTLEDKSSKKKKKTPKSEKKKKRQKSTDVIEMKDLPSVFSEKVKLRQNGSQKRPSLLQRRSMPPRADFDEFSDSDESHFSADASLKRTKDRRNMTEEELNLKIARRVQSAARKQLKQKEQKRLRIAQEIQRQLEEVDVKQKELEERGVVVEKALRGDGDESGRDETQLMQEWFNLVYEKNALVRYESELMVNAQYMELEDRHGRLEQELRERMAINNELKTPEQAAEEKRILDELLEVVEEKNNLVKMIEEDRVREREEDRDLMQMMRAKGFDLDPIDHTQHLKNSCGFPLSS